jgi:hypothetical protein
MLYAVTIDTEEEWDWASGYPTGPAAVENIRQLPRFQQAMADAGAAVTYFVNHAVLSDPAACGIIQELAARPNVEIGFHIHPWNTPPLANMARVPTRDSFLHNLPEAEQVAKLETVWAAFRAAGLTPTSYRGGRYSTSAFIQDWLHDHGFTADCSFVPYTTWADDGAPDHRQRDLMPRRNAPRRLGAQALWELPLSFGYTRKPHRLWRSLFAAGEKFPLRPLKFNSVVEKIGLCRKSWLNFENPLGERMLGFLAGLPDVPFVCFTLHSSSLWPGGSPYSRTAADVDRLYARAAAALAAARSMPGSSPATCAAAVMHLENRYARDRDQPAG